MRRVMLVTISAYRGYALMDYHHDHEVDAVTIHISLSRQTVTKTMANPVPLRLSLAGAIIEFVCLMLKRSWFLRLMGSHDDPFIPR